MPELYAYATTYKKYCNIMKYMLTWNWKASCEWVSCKSLITAADWAVVNNFTACVQATCTRTWIYTFLVHTCSVLCTF